MASIFKQTFTTSDPKTRKKVRRKSTHWYISYVNADGIRCRVRGYKDKTATAQLAAKLEKESELEQSGVIDRYKQHRIRPLSEHLADYKLALLAKGSTQQHVNQQAYRIERIFSACGFRTFADVQASRILTFIDVFRKTVEVNATDNKGNQVKKTKDLGAISAQSKKYYLTAIKSFFRWMQKDNRMADNPIEYLEPKSVTKNDINKRRALEPKEAALLLDGTAKAGVSYGMDGLERALLYRLAIESGLRSNELRSLTVSSFDFKARTVTLEADSAKNRREAVLPLKIDTADMLKAFVFNKMPSAIVFNMPYPCNVVRMFRRDLQAIGIDSADNGRGKLDFHSLRHTTGSFLAASGVHPKTAQNLLRHSTIDLTMNIYTHTVKGAEAAAIQSLPNFSQLIKAQTDKTGTDDNAVILPDNQPDNEPYFYRHNQSLHDSMDIKTPQKERLCNSFEIQDLTQGDSGCQSLGEMGRAGVEPATHGFSVRCSTN